MTLSLGLFCLWAVTANLLAMFPSKRHHWPAAYFLLVTGLPLIVLVFRENPHWVSALVFLLWCSVLRWPILYGGRFLKRVFRIRSSR